MELETVEVTLGTLDLREFKVVPRRNCKRRKKRDKKVEKGEEEELAGDTVLGRRVLGKGLPWLALALFLTTHSLCRAPCRRGGMQWYRVRAAEPGAGDGAAGAAWG